MNHLYYQTKINDVIIKCPIEAGIEILVYNVLDEIVNMEEYAIVDINRIWKNQDSRLTTEAGISDIAVLSTDFIFKKEDVGEVYGFIEVKAAGVLLTDTVQVCEQMKKVTHFIYTNGITWKYYLNQELKWVINISENKALYSITEITVDKDKFGELIKKLNNIQWRE